MTIRIETADAICPDLLAYPADGPEPILSTDPAYDDGRLLAACIECHPALTQVSADGFLAARCAACEEAPTAMPFATLATVYVDGVALCSECAA